MSQEAERVPARLDSGIAEPDARILELETDLARRRGDLRAHRW